MNTQTSHTGTTPFKGMTFGFDQAVTAVKAGKGITRTGFNGAGQCIYLQNPGGGGKLNVPYLYIKTVEGNFVPWLASQTDILANDWHIVE